jgi:hypothetical protein
MRGFLPTNRLSFRASGSESIYDSYCGWTNTTSDVRSCMDGFFRVFPCEPHVDILWCTVTAPRDIGISGELLEQKELPANAFRNRSDIAPLVPSPPNSCTLQSAGRPVVWRLQGWYMQTVWQPYFPANTTVSTVSFLLNSSALDGPNGTPLIAMGWNNYDLLTPYQRRSAPAAWYGLDKSSEGPPNGLKWAWRFDAAVGYLELSHSWYCEDLDTAHP